MGNSNFDLKVFQENVYEIINYDSLDDAKNGSHVFNSTEKFLEIKFKPIMMEILMIKAKEKGIGFNDCFSLFKNEITQKKGSMLGEYFVKQFKEFYQNYIVPEIKSAIQNPIVKNHLCPLLTGFAGDVLDIARIITPILASLILNDIVKIRLHPEVFAGIARSIAKLGVDKFCLE